MLTVQAFAKGLLSAFGHSPTLAVRGLAGEVEFDADAADTASLNLTVSADSLAVIDNISEADRREIERKTREEVLESARYPEIVFQPLQVLAQRTGEGQFHVRLNGHLSMHGVTRTQSIEAGVALTQNCLRAQGKTQLRQSDYRIEPVTALGGAIKLKDELELTFDIIACSP
ncbi:MAG: YceI family protein [Blastocatellia bacterium]|nr:YceI family protein [Blastocatellia bacterium]